VFDANIVDQLRGGCVHALSAVTQGAKADFLYLSRELRLRTPATFRRNGSD
jgi:hypothetical protein